MYAPRAITPLAVANISIVFTFFLLRPAYLCIVAEDERIGDDGMQKVCTLQSFAFENTYYSRQYRLRFTSPFFGACNEHILRRDLSWRASYISTLKLTRWRESEDTIELVL